MKRIFLATLLLLFVPGLASASTPEKSYIVVYKDSVAISKEVTSLRSEDVRVQRVYSEVFPGAQVMLSSEEYQELAKDPRVRFLERDGLAEKTSLPWGIDRIDQRSLPLSGSYTPPSRGAGTRAYILDTGVRSDHREFTGRMLPGWTAIRDGKGSEDCDGHGTHVAGTVAGTSFGVAPEASIVPVRVLDCAGSGSWSGIVDALDWIVSVHEPGQTAVANMSLGGRKLDSVNAAVERVVAAGVPVAVAAGNSDDNACDYSPASAPSAWTVGATNSSDARSYFSNWGSCVDIFAPGSDILSAGIDSPSSALRLSGTSMASPHVAGALALLGDEISARATNGLLSGVPGGTVNRMLYLGSEAEPPPPAAPANDNFAQAASLLRNNEGSTVLATREQGEPRHVHALTGSENSIWYRWTAPMNGTVTLSTAGSNFDTLLAVYRGDALRNLDLVAANDDGAADFTSRTGFPASAGTTYHIAVDGYGGRTGRVRLEHLYVPVSVSISSGPPEITRSRSAEFHFSGAECSLDGAPWSACSSPLAISNLSDGQHTFRVRYNEEERSWSWTVDGTAPNAPFIVQSRDQLLWETEAGASSFCSLGAGSPRPCSSPFSLGDLRPGEYRFRVWQEDQMGNRSEAGTINFVISGRDEESKPLRIISGPRRKAAPRRAVFVFEGAGGFRCRLDQGAWKRCSSPLRIRGLSAGKHKLSVQDSSGAQRSYRWKVRSKRP